MTQLIDLGKLRFSFAGDYAGGTIYELNDIVKYGGNVYVYTNPVKAAGHEPSDETYWALLVPGISFDGVYSNSAVYRVGDGVSYGGKVYVCIKTTTAGTNPTNATYWSLFADGIQWEGDYQSGTQYTKNDVVKFGGSLFIASQNTQGNAPSNATYWDKFVDGISASGVYNPATTYNVNQLVAYGANIYRALQTTVGNVPSGLGANWEILVPGMRFTSTWTTGTSYVPNDMVQVGNLVYICLVAHTAGTFATDLGTSKWQLFVSGIKYSSDWATSSAYNVNDIVSYGGQSYICLTAHSSTVFATDLAASKWQKFNSGIRWRGNWVGSTAYLTNDVVYDGVSSTYIVTADYTSDGSVAADVTAGKLSMFAQGANVTGLPSVSTSTKNKRLANDGTTLAWTPEYSFPQYIDLAL